MACRPGRPQVSVRTCGGPGRRSSPSASLSATGVITRSASHELGDIRRQTLRVYLVCSAFEVRLGTDSLSAKARAPHPHMDGARALGEQQTVASLGVLVVSLFSRPRGMCTGVAHVPLAFDHAFFWFVKVEILSLKCCFSMPPSGPPHSGLVFFQESPPSPLPGRGWIRKHE